MRRQLKFGEKIKFEDIDGAVYSAIVRRQDKQYVEVFVIGINKQEEIHRRQVISVFKKKEKPLIVSVHKSYLENAKEGVGIVSRIGASDHPDWTCFRPLTKKERERWGV